MLSRPIISQRARLTAFKSTAYDSLPFSIGTSGTTPPRVLGVPCTFLSIAVSCQPKKAMRGSSCWGQYYFIPGIAWSYTFLQSISSLIKSVMISSTANVNQNSTSRAVSTPACFIMVLCTVITTWTMRWTAVLDMEGHRLTKWETRCRTFQKHRTLFVPRGIDTSLNQLFSQAEGTFTYLYIIFPGYSQRTLHADPWSSACYTTCCMF